MAQYIVKYPDRCPDVKQQETVCEALKDMEKGKIKAIFVSKDLEIQKFPSTLKAKLRGFLIGY